ncbi:MAG: hypothetical protein JST87_05235 [Bacteroidetes bacterium]|nr:hypothetical protein [Bacteroidota bacterium]
MAQIQVSIEGSLINSSNNFVVALYDSTAPTVVLESQAPTKPYSNPFQVTFAYDATIGRTYIVKLWESADTTPSGTVRNSTSITPSANSTSVRFNDELIVDTSAGLTSGTDTYVNSSYIGWDLWFERKGEGTMFATTGTPEYTYDKTTGTITLPSGITFQPGEEFVTHFYPQIGTNIQTVSGGISSGVIISANTTFDNTYKNKAIFCQGSTSQLVCSLPALSTLLDYDYIYIYSNGGSHINLVLNTQGTDKINSSSQVTQIILGQCEVLKLFKANGVFNIDNDIAGVLGVGEFVYTMALVDANTLQCAGQLVNRADYPRLWAWVQTLDSSMLVTEAALATTDGNGNLINQAKFSSGTTSSNFRLPKLTNYELLKVVDGTARKAGSFEEEDLKPHSHVQTLFQAVNNGGLKPVGFSGTTGSLTNSVYSTANNTSTSGRNKLKNTGVYALIRI